MVEKRFLYDEVRCGFYVPTAIKQAWATQLDILSAIDRICKKYDIKYFAEWGTLLGTVRHGGFVPWDDDIDISMMRSDYERFLQVAKKELPEGFAVHNFDSKDGHWLFLARVVNTNSICFDKKHLDKFYNFPYIATVDIFILDYLYEDEERERERCDEVKSIIATADAIVGSECVLQGAEFKLQLLERKYNVVFDRSAGAIALGKALYALAEKQMGRTKPDESTRIGQIFPWVLKGSRGLPKECYESTVRLPFETTTISVPIRYHQVLSSRYGDYFKVHKIWGGHDYPYFEGQRKSLQAVADFALPEFRFDERLMRGETCDEHKETFKEIVAQCVDELGKNVDTIMGLMCECRYEEIMDILMQTQQLAIDLGTLLEQVKGEEHPGVKRIVVRLEALCEEIYGLYQMLAQGCNQVAGGDASEDDILIQGESVSEEPVAQYMSKMAELCREIALMVGDEIVNKKEVLFVSIGADYWQGFDCLYRAAAQEKDTEVSVVYVPRYRKDVYGQILSVADANGLSCVNEAVKSEAAECGYPGYVTIKKWNEYNLELLHPDMIYIQDPYDGQNPCLTVPNVYYSKNLQSNTDKLVYVPWYHIDEFGPEDTTTIYNMKHYVTAPGLICADVVYAQSENMRKMFIDKLSEFAGEDTRDYWQEKLVVMEEETEAGKHSVPKKQRKRVLYCIGENEFSEHENIIERITEKLRVFSDNALAVETDICLYPAYDIWDKAPNKILSELHNRLDTEYGDIKYIEMDTSVSDIKDIMSKYDAYYGSSSPYVLEFLEQKKPVMLAEY